jgi:hypothetical protein
MLRINLTIDLHRYHDIQTSSTSLNHSILGKENQGIIRTLAVNCTQILDWTKNDGKTVMEIASDEMVMGAL